MNAGTMIAPQMGVKSWSSNPGVLMGGGAVAAAVMPSVGGGLAPLDPVGNTLDHVIEVAGNNLGVFFTTYGLLAAGVIASKYARTCILNKIECPENKATFDRWTPEHLGIVTMYAGVGVSALTMAWEVGSKMFSESLGEILRGPDFAQAQGDLTLALAFLGIVKGMEIYSKETDEKNWGVFLVAWLATALCLVDDVTPIMLTLVSWGVL